MSLKIDWVIHCVANGACDECNNIETGFLPYACNAHTHGMMRYLSTLQQMNFLSCAERLNAVSFAICCRIRKKVEIKLHFISALEVLLQKS